MARRIYPALSSDIFDGWASKPKSFPLVITGARHLEALRNFHRVTLPPVSLRYVPKVLWRTCDCHGLLRTWGPGSGRTDVFLPIRTGQKSPETLKLRKMVADGCEKLIWRFFDGGGQVVIYDANNGARSQRQAIAEKFDKKGIHVIYLGTSKSEPVRFCVCLRAIHRITLR